MANMLLWICTIKGLGNQMNMQNAKMQMQRFYTLPCKAPCDATITLVNLR